ncbi:Sulfotransferase 4A1, partial [Gracilaria domingensis]
VIIASNYASGSNLIQHMTYQLLVATNRVPSDLDESSYSDTTAVVPITELCHALNLHKPHHRRYPQVCKTHLDIQPFLKQSGHKGRKILYCIRNPLDVCRILDFTGEW